MRHAFLYLFLLPVSSLWAQLNGKYQFTHINQSNGLLHTSVKGIGQDAHGFIWVLTLSGLQRYDGSRFVNYTDITRQSTFGILNDSELYLDTFHNDVWVTKVQEMQKLDLNTKTMITLPLKEVISQNTTYPSYTFHVDDQMDILMSVYGVIDYKRNSDSLLGYFFNVNPGQYHRNTYIIKDAASGKLLTHNFNYILIADPVSGTVHSSAHPGENDPLLTQLRNLFGDKARYQFLLQDSYHNLWISTWTDILLRYNKDEEKLFTYSLKEIRKAQNENTHENNILLVTSMYEDRQKNLWFAADYMGLLKYVRETDQFDFITSDEKINNGIHYNYTINTIFQDRDNNIWLGTDRGISIFNPYQNYFEIIRHIDGNSHSLPKKDIDDIIQTREGEILVGTWGGGITIYDEHWNYIRNVDFGRIPEHNLVWSFVELDDGTIWAGAQAGYIHIYDPVKHSFTTIRPKEVGYSTITKMCKDRGGNILIGTHDGTITFWDKKENVFYKMDDSAKRTPLTFATIVNLFVDKSNRCWVGTALGLFEFDLVKRKFKHLYQPDGVKEEVGINVQGIVEYNDSMLIIGTIYNGLFLFDLNSHKFSRPSFIDQLQNISVNAIAKDKESNLWFSTNNSIFRVNDHDQVARFNLTNSMINAVLSSPILYELNDGRFTTWSPAEIICFNPAAINSEPLNQLQVQICGFKVNEALFNIDTFLNKNQEIILPYDKNFISFEFAALDFTGTRQINYEYQLSGVDKNWVHSSTKQFADYTDLKPGNYVFQVKADNGNGTSGITSIPMTINPPWWLSTWFIIICILTLAYLVYFFLKTRIKRIRKEAGLKQRIAETEMMALRAQMNPHFIFNCLNSIDNLIQTDQKAKATNYLAKFAQLIRAILENSKSNAIPAWKDLDALKLYLEMEALRWDDKIASAIHIDPQIQSGDYKVPPMVVQPFVENAIHHGLLNKRGSDKKLDIDVRLDHNRIKYTITDNGVGRAKAAEYKKINNMFQKSFGMQITHERIGLFNGAKNNSVHITDLYDDQHESCGTRVEVWLTTQFAE